MNDKLDDLVAAAQEAEADPDRHDMEAAVLASVVRHGVDSPELWQAAAAVAWSRKDHAALYKALVRCMEEGFPPDAILVRDRLDHLVTVADDTLTAVLDGSRARDAAVAVEYVQRMDRQDRFRRAEDLVRAAGAAVELAKKDRGKDPDAAVAGLLKGIFDLAHDRKVVREYPKEADAAAGFLDELCARRTDGRTYLGLETGFHHLDEVFNGLTPGLYILAGPPSTGKTTLAKQLADMVAQIESVPVLYWTFEQSREELRIKSLSRFSDIDTRVIWKGRAGNDAWSKVEKAADKYRRGPGRTLTIVEAGRDDTVDRIRAAAVMAKHGAADKPVFVVIDYLQILPAGPDAPDALRERIDYNLSELRRLSRDLSSPVLVVSSQNRDAYKGNLRPTLASLKESGGIEYSADAVICLWRDADESKRLTQDYKRLTVRVEAAVLKNRNGELAKVKLDFTPAWSVFQEAGREDLDWSKALGSET